MAKEFADNLAKETNEANKARREMMHVKLILISLNNKPNY